MASFSLWECPTGAVARVWVTRPWSWSAKWGLEDDTASYGQEKKLWVNIAVCLPLSVSHTTEALNPRIKRRIYFYKELLWFSLIMVIKHRFPPLQGPILALIHPWYANTKHNGRKDKITSFTHKNIWNYINMSAVLKERIKKTTSTAKTMHTFFHKVTISWRGLNSFGLVWFGLVWFYGIWTIVGYFMPNLLYTYILNIYDL